MVSRRGAAGRTENKVDSRRETRMNMRTALRRARRRLATPRAVLVRPQEIFSSSVYIRVAAVEILAVHRPPEAVYATAASVTAISSPVIRLNNSTTASTPRQIRPCKYFTGFFTETPIFSPPFRHFLRAKSRSCLDASAEAAEWLSRGK